ncbi:TonB-dependent receptor domain-containing protein [Sandaracinus amylolyticus]|uniref:TonB-dependent receptor domain-containing protein n=1 Tax=Sandaracinus amylolyticus TaxID=927083 RepID=UPI001F4824E1|nr:TonB-dependent receptor [Sandaracinus amylolyticus]
MNPTLWARCVLAIVTTLCVTTPALAQTPGGGGGDVPAGGEGGPTAPDATLPAPTEPAEEAPAEEPADEAAISEAEQAEIDAALAADAPHCSGTGVEGVVRDAQTRETMIEAPVIVVGRGTRVLTDYDGRFAIDLPPGTYSLRSYYDLYQPTRVDDIVVTRGSCTAVDVELSSETSTGEEIVIEVRAERGTAASQLRMRRESAAVQDAISSEEMRRSPDSSASEAVRRTVGVVTRDDYVYVRGLGGRYVVTTLNGVALPNTDPDVPGVQLDIFPSGLLEALTIRKTFTPEVPGDWAGGLVDVSTQTFPSDFQLRFGLGFGVNTAVSFQRTLGYEGGATDFLGFDDGTRALPGGAENVRAGDLTPEQRDQLALQFPNTWQTNRRTAWPNLSLSFSMGDTIDVGGHLLGYLLMVGYRYTERPIPDVIRAVRLEGEGEDAMLTLREELQQEGVEIQAQLSALATVTFEVVDRNQLTFTGLFSQNADNFLGRVTGVSEYYGTQIDSRRQSWLQRTLAYGQLLGEHTDLPAGARFDWQLNLSYGQREQPDLRDILYVQNGDQRFWAPGPESGARFYSDLDDVTYGAGANLTIPIDTLQVRLGGLTRQTDRGLRVRRFGFQTRPGSDPSGTMLPPETLFSPELINVFTSLREYTREDDSYDATQSLYAGYLSGEWRPWQPLRLIAGARVEAFRQVVESAPPVGMTTSEIRGTRRTDVDVLPSGGAIVEIHDNMFVRASYAGTVARPQVRELAPFLFADFVRRRTITGNPELERTYIHNFDLRWEWFPSESEVLAVSGFAKVFEAPIEQTIVSSGGDLSYRNIAGAENYGVELEARMHFGHFVDGLDWLTLGGNLALVYSRARLTEDQLLQATSSERPLAGQPPYIVNVQLGIAPPDTNLSFAVYYNIFGPRLEDVGLLGLPDVYLDPYHSVDLTATWEPDPHVTIRFAAQNLLFQRRELRQGDFVIVGYDPGTQFSLSVGYSY